MLTFDLSQLLHKPLGNIIYLSTLIIRAKIVYLYLYNFFILKTVLQIMMKPNPITSFEDEKATWLGLDLSKIHLNWSFFFFFYEIESKKGRTGMMQPLWISKNPCITEEKGKLIKWEGGGVGVCEPGFWRFEDC